jgi:hypothetical protein
MLRDRRLDRQVVVNILVAIHMYHPSSEALQDLRHRILREATALNEEWAGVLATICLNPTSPRLGPETEKAISNLATTDQGHRQNLDAISMLPEDFLWKDASVLPDVGGLDGPQGAFVVRTDPASSTSDPLFMVEPVDDTASDARASVTSLVGTLHNQLTESDIQLIGAFLEHRNPLPPGVTEKKIKLHEHLISVDGTMKRETLSLVLDFGTFHWQKKRKTKSTGKE